jgi:hypothetical protein
LRENGSVGSLLRETKLWRKDESRDWRGRRWPSMQDRKEAKSGQGRRSRAKKKQETRNRKQKERRKQSSQVVYCDDEERAAKTDKQSMGKMWTSD